MLVRTFNRVLASNGMKTRPPNLPSDVHTMWAMALNTHSGFQAQTRQIATISECRYRWLRVPATRHQALENIDVFKGFLLSRIWPAISLVEAARGKSQRKFGGVARWGDQRSATSGPNDGLEESLISSTCARSVHREIQENLKTAQTERPRCISKIVEGVFVPKLCREISGHRMTASGGAKRPFVRKQDP